MPDSAHLTACPPLPRHLSMTRRFVALATDRGGGQGARRPRFSLTTPAPARTLRRGRSPILNDRSGPVVSSGDRAPPGTRRN